MLKLCSGELEHVLPAVEQRPSGGVINASLRAVEAFEGPLLAGEGVDVGGIAVIERLEEARVGELAVDDEGRAERDGERDEGEEEPARERVLAREREGVLGRDVEHAGGS